MKGYVCVCRGGGGRGGLERGKDGSGLTGWGAAGGFWLFVWIRTYRPILLLVVFLPFLRKGLLKRLRLFFVFGREMGRKGRGRKGKERKGKDRKGKGR